MIKVVVYTIFKESSKYWLFISRLEVENWGFARFC